MSAKRSRTDGSRVGGRGLAPLAMMLALLAGCDAPAPEASGNSGVEVTVILPPATEEEAPPTNAAIEEPSPAPEVAEEPAAPEEQAAEAGLVPAPPPIAMSSLARYIRGAGFDCDEVVSSTQLERGGERVGIYKFDCGTGGSYQGTMRQNHLYFREWRGMPTG